MVPCQPGRYYPTAGGGINKVATLWPADSGKERWGGVLRFKNLQA